MSVIARSIRNRRGAPARGCGMCPRGCHTFSSPKSIWPAARDRRRFLIFPLLLTSRLNLSFILNTSLGKRILLCGGCSSKLGSSSGLGCTTDEANDLAYCHVCVSALKQKKMKESNAEPSFISSGYSNWKDATVAFKKDQLSACHHKAVDVMITIPSTTRDIGEQLSQIHRQEKATNRRMFLKILSSIRYLARQGLALRSDGDEQDGNFLQVLKLKGEDDPVTIDWLKRKANKYTSHQNQNDILRIMAVNVLREVAVCMSTTITLHHLDDRRNNR